MDRKDTDIEEVDDRLMPSVHEQLECRRVFDRLNVPAPDAEAEWERFRREMARRDVARRRRSLSFYMAGGLIASVAAAALWFFVIPSFRSIEHPLPPFKSPVLSISFPISHADSGFVQPGSATSQGLIQNKLTVASDIVSMQTVTVPHGTDRQLTLPDGTKVWLYAESKIQYPELFCGSQRQVWLQGGAFFEVKKDLRRPFVVCGDFFSTTVHGTAFAIDAYSEDEANVILVSGSVAVQKNGDASSYDIQPGEMAELGQDGRFEIHETDTWPCIQRRNGYFYFNREPLGSLMRELGRWYNVNVVFEDPNLMNIRFHFVAERNQNLQTVIRGLNDIGSVEVSYDDGTLTVR